MHVYIYIYIHMYIDIYIYIYIYIYYNALQPPLLQPPVERLRVRPEDERYIYI